MNKFQVNCACKGTTILPYVVNFESIEIVMRLAGIMKSSKILFWASLVIALFPNSLSAQFKNIVLSAQTEGKYPPLEPSIVVNPGNPKNIVAGIVLDRSVYTIDGGLSWKETVLKSSYGVYGDPALIADSKGNVYYFHLADPSGKGRSSDEWLDRISCQKYRAHRLQ